MAASQTEPSCEQQQRADLYALLSALLLGPDPQLVGELGRMEAGAEHTALGQAWRELVQAAGLGADCVRDEYDALFVAAGTPRLNPYQCYYLAGWLMDKPLAALRQDLQQLGLARVAGATELEDHLGALCEVMRLLIERGAPAQVQQEFFARHLAGWSASCLQDIAAAPGACFYRAVAGLGLAFFELESQHAPTPA